MDTLLVRLLVAVLLCIATPAYAAVGFVQAPTAGTALAATACTTGSATWTGGNAIVVVMATTLGSSGITSITQSAGSNTYIANPRAIRNSSPGVEVWHSLNITGGTFSITVNLSAAAGLVCVAAEYSGVSGIGVGNSSAPAATTNPSIAITTSAATSWCVAGLAANDNTAFTAGATSALRRSGTTTSIGGALVDTGPIASKGGTCTDDVTHGSANWGIGAVELYTGTLQIGNGAYSLGGGGGPNGYLSGFNGNLDAVQATTAGNSGGYTVNSICVLTDDNGSAGNLRGAIYTDSSGAPNTLVANSDTGSVAFGTPAGAGTPNLHCHAVGGTVTLTASTTYWPEWNNDTAAIAYRVDSTTCAAGGAADDFAASVFGAPPGTFPAVTPETCGPHFWLDVTPVSSGGTPATPERSKMGVGT